MGLQVKGRADYVADAAFFGLRFQTFRYGSESLKFHADRILVNETYREGWRIQTASDHYGYYQRQEKHRETTVEEGRAHLQRSGEFSYVKIYPRPGPLESFQVSAAHTAFKLQPQASTSFLSVQVNRIERNSFARAFHEDSRPSIRIANESTVDGYTLRGNFTLEVYDVDISVQGRPGVDHVFRSGYVPRSQKGAGGVYVAEEDEKITLRFHLENATLHLDPRGRPHQVNLLHLEGRFQGRLAHESATGLLKVPAGSARVRASNLTIDAADLKEDLAPLSLISGPVLRGSFEGQGAVPRVNGKPLAAVPAPNDGSGPDPVVSWLLGAGLLFGLGLSARRLRGPASLARGAQDALVDGRFARALRLARRALAKDPSRSDAITVLLTSLLRLGRPAEVLAALEAHPSVAHIDEASRLLVRALALSDLGQVEAATKVAEGAIRLDPGLEPELHGSRLHQELLGARREGNPSYA